MLGWGCLSWRGAPPSGGRNARSPRTRRLVATPESKRSAVKGGTCRSCRHVASAAARTTGKAGSVARGTCAGNGRRGHINNTKMLQPRGAPYEPIKLAYIYRSMSCVRLDLHVHRAYRGASPERPSPQPWGPRWADITRTYRRTYPDISAIQLYLGAMVAVAAIPRMIVGPRTSAETMAAKVAREKMIWVLKKARSGISPDRSR